MFNVFISEDAAEKLSVSDVASVKALALASCVLDGEDRDAIDSISKKLFGHKIDDLAIVKALSKTLSTKQLAEVAGVGIKEVNNRLCEANLQFRFDNRYKLTDKGLKFGAYAESGQRKIVWDRKVVNELFD